MGNGDQYTGWDHYIVGGGAQYLVWDEPNICRDAPQYMEKEDHYPYA